MNGEFSNVLDNDNTSDDFFMGEAMKQARKGYQADEVPIGAVIVRSGKIIARAYNQTRLLKDATAHAEMLAITSAEASIGDWRLEDCDLYVTKEPCPMCAGALVLTRVKRVIFGMSDDKAGAAGGKINVLQLPTLNHRCEVTPGVREEECRTLVQTFFKEKRIQSRERGPIEQGASEDLTNDYSPSL